MATPSSPDTSSTTTPTAPTGAELGPFKQTFSRTVEIAGPIRFTLTETTESTHVPPPKEAHKPCGGCGGGKASLSIDDILNYLPHIVELISQRMNAPSTPSVSPE